MMKDNFNNPAFSGMRMLFVLWLCGAQMAAAAPNVVVSIKPLQLIATAITEGVTMPTLVWTQGQDPHHISLRPSERRLLGDADLLLWIGPMLERPLADVIDDLDGTILTVQDMQGLELIDVDGTPDPHVWVDTRNARLIATTLSDALVREDAENAAQYRANLAGFHSALDVLDAELKQLFATSASREWAVYHHALRYVERAYNLLPPLTLSDSENNAPGLRTAVQVREQLQQKQITCMLMEPGVNHDEVSTMLDLPAVRLIDADVMGQGSAASGDYPSYMRALAATLAQCLGVAP
jgi:zinc transport system substrate-binding protein